MRKFILIVLLLFVSAGAYAGQSPGLTFAASETIEQIRPAEKPAVATEPSVRTKTDTTTKSATKANTDTAQPSRARRAARPVNARSAKRPMSPSDRSLPSNEDEARRMGAKYGITW